METELRTGQADGFDHGSNALILKRGNVDFLANVFNHLFVFRGVFV